VNNETKEKRDTTKSGGEDGKEERYRPKLSLGPQGNSREGGGGEIIPSKKGSQIPGSGELKQKARKTGVGVPQK